MNNKLDALCTAWKVWAESADRSENGWQSDFESWDDLMNVARVTMLASSLTAQDLPNLELCWQISEEYETLADFAKENIDECRRALESLARSNYAEVRWQVIDAVTSAPGFGEVIVRRGLEDSDPYCRRRAILALVHMKPDEIPTIKQQYANDPDSLIRNAVDSLVP